MSRNFDLIQEVEIGSAFQSPSTVMPTIVVPDASPKSGRYRQLNGEAALSLVQRIFLRRTQSPPRMIVFAGIDHGNGCSEIAASVAETLAVNANGDVCLVDANFRSQGPPELFGPNHHGLTDALLQQAPIRSFVKPACDGRLWLLSSGARAWDSAHLLTSERLNARLTELRVEFKFVLVDAPPLTQYADAIGLGKISDGVVLVIEAESTRREAALAAVENLRSSSIPILGAVLNKRTFPIPEKIYSRL